MIALVAAALAQPHTYARDTGDVGVGVSLGGGAFPALDVSVYAAEHVALDFAIGPRWGFGDDLYLNVAGVVGLVGDFGTRRAHAGPFVRLGSTLPGAFTESFVAGGVDARWLLGSEGRHVIALDVGPGWFFVRDLPSVHHQTSFLLYVKVGWSVYFG
ncbi:MAG: hypothetical protein ACOZNI_08195 [Myxococcota bacterium]